VPGAEYRALAGNVLRSNESFFHNGWEPETYLRFAVLRRRAGMAVHWRELRRSRIHREGSSVVGIGGKR
jgi:hypothetical protein